MQPAALLDLRFHSASGKKDILAAVSSTGTLAIFRLDPKPDSGSVLQHLRTSRCDDLEADVLFLQCQWGPSILGTSIAVTTSTGLVRLLFLDEEWAIKDHTDLDISNSLEAWSIAFAPLSSSAATEQNQVSVYSGGDDSVLRYTSLQRLDHNGQLGVQGAYASAMIKRQHDAGITAVLPLAELSSSGGRLVLTGSYDDTVRLFAVHDLHVSHGQRYVEPLADYSLGGGVWRLDLIDSNIVDTAHKPARLRIRILASCMHAGARIIEVVEDLAGGGWGFELLGRFEEHQSMNYASDFMPGSRKSTELKCVSTSFYDKLLCMWTFVDERKVAV